MINGAQEFAWTLLRKCKMFEYLLTRSLEIAITLSRERRENITCFTNIIWIAVSREKRETIHLEFLIDGMDRRA